MAKRKRSQWQTIIYKTLHRIQNSKQRELAKNWGWTRELRKGERVPAQHMVPVMLLLGCLFQWLILLAYLSNTKRVYWAYHQIVSYSRHDTAEKYFIEIKIQTHLFLTKKSLNKLKGVISGLNRRRIDNTMSKSKR